jgi:type I restriction enzyme S subunit
MNKVKLNDIAEVLSGMSFRRYITDPGEEHQVIVQRSIQDGILKDFDKVNLNPRSIKPHHLTQVGDVLMKMPYPYDVVCVNQPNLVISDRIAIIRLKEGYHPSFISHLLTNIHVKKQLYEFESSERIPHVSIKQIKELELLIPDYDVQVKYGELLDTINEKIIEDLRLVQYDRNLKEGILNKLWENE